MKINNTYTTFGELKPGDCFYLLTDRFGEDLRNRLFMKTKDCIRGYDSNENIVCLSGGEVYCLGSREVYEQEPVLKADVEITVHNASFF